MHMTHVVNIIRKCNGLGLTICFAKTVIGHYSIPSFQEWSESHNNLPFDQWLRRGQLHFHVWHCQFLQYNYQNKKNSETLCLFKQIKHRKLNLCGILYYNSRKPKLCFIKVDLDILAVCYTELYVHRVPSVVPLCSCWMPRKENYTHQPLNTGNWDTQRCINMDYTSFKL